MDRKMELYWSIQQTHQTKRCDMQPKKLNKHFLKVSGIKQD